MFFSARSLVFALAALMFIALAARPNHPDVPRGLYIGLSLVALGHFLP